MPHKATGSGLQLIPWHHNILATLSERIMENHRESLPDLSHISILLSDIQAASQLRSQLLAAAQRKGVDAILGPTVTTLKDYAKQHYIPESIVIGHQARELMLVEALLEHPNLYGSGSPWLLAKNLLELFDELTRHHVSLPDNIEDFTEDLGQAYGLPDSSHTALGQEATLVHTLWQAMQLQLQDAGLIDEATASLLCLTQSVLDTDKNKIIKTPGTATNMNATCVYMAGLFDFVPAEIQWINALLSQKQLTLISQSDCITPDTENHRDEKTRWLEHINTPAKYTNTSDTAARFIQQVYDYESDTLLNRASRFSRQYPVSPIQSHISVFSASNDEEEALAVDLRIRQWLIEGRKNLAIVTDNRRLARRVRALLERANIILHDTSGWALSTTSAATVIERWLESIEQNFHHQAFIDFLKSSFVCLQPDRTQHLAAVYRFEKDVIQRENIASDLHRYKTHVEYRRKRLNHDRTGYYDDVVSILAQVEQAAGPLQNLLAGVHNPVTFIKALQQSLSFIGVSTSLAVDEAGQRLLDELQKLIHACQYTQLSMDWSTFRHWLGETLERYNFNPQMASQKHNSKVTLLSLMQSDCQRFDGLIFAAAEQEFLPGKSGSSPFFNNAVRTRLGIPPLQQHRERQFLAFRRLLESVDSDSGNALPNILFTRRHQQGDEDIVPSPWLEALQTFHQLAWGHNLADNTILMMLRHPGSHIKTDDRPLPEVIPEHPASNIPPELLPDTVSATSLQSLINCPYQFFAATCLKLSAPDDVREQMEKDEYGQRVHLCLEAFHKNVKDLPGPFSDRIDQHNIDSATSLLEEISHKVFSTDIENNFLHRGWLKQWLDQIPLYINWQMKHEEEWRVQKAEFKIDNISFTPDVKLRGVLDRVDHNSQNNDQLGIIDYKTGFIPSQDDVDAGEAVQLPFYVLAANQANNHTGETGRITRAEYLSLSRDAKKFGAKVFLEEEQLEDLSYRNGIRLDNIMSALRDNHLMPAWGDENSCRFCRLEGLCRKQLWDRNNTSESLDQVLQ